MFGLVLGIIVLLAGVGVGVFLATKSEEEYQKNENGDYVYDKDYNRILVKTHPTRKYSWISFVVGAALAVLFIFCGSVANVDTGCTGVVTTFGRVENYTLDSGFHMKAPWKNLITMDNRIQKATVDLSCFSQDIQEVNCKYTLNYQISKNDAQEIYKTIGIDYYDTVIVPNVSESVKTIMAHYTAEVLIGNRDELAKSIEELLAAQLEKYHIEIVGTAIEDIDFQDGFTEAVEAKQIAQQNKLKAATEQEQKTMEAQQAAERAKIQATADAEVAKIQAEADMQVAKIGADSAEYQGRKEASIALQRLASINGWTVIMDAETGLNTIYKATGEEVTSEELKIGAQNLMQYYYVTQWDGVLPQYYLADDANILLPIGD